MKYICPVCKYDGLYEEPYDENGTGSDEICPCCGFQFGCDDFPEGELQIKNWREGWAASGYKWFSQIRKAPLNWNPQHQTTRWIFEHDDNGQLVKCAENKRQEGGINIITISIRYKMMNSKNWLNISLTADDYFDLDPEEVPEIWSVPKSDKPLDYIKYDRDSVESIILSISDPVKNERLTLKQKFWNGQQNYLLESVEEKQGNIDIELILQTLVQDDPNNEIWEVIRFSREDGLLSPTFHSFITENQEGLVSEKIIPVPGR